MNKLFLISIFTLFLVLPNQQSSYAELLDLKKHIAVQLDEDSNQLTITNITKQNVYDQERLKLNKLDLENRWAFFIKSIPSIFFIPSIISLSILLTALSVPKYRPCANLSK